MTLLHLSQLCVYLAFAILGGSVLVFWVRASILAFRSAYRMTWVYVYRRSEMICSGISTAVSGLLLVAFAILFALTVGPAVTGSLFR